MSGRKPGKNVWNLNPKRLHILVVRAEGLAQGADVDSQVKVSKPKKSGYSSVGKTNIVSKSSDPAYMGIFSIDNSSPVLALSFSVINSKNGSSLGEYVADGLDTLVPEVVREVEARLVPKKAKHNVSGVLILRFLRTELPDRRIQASVLEGGVDPNPYPTELSHYYYDYYVTKMKTGDLLLYSGRGPLAVYSQLVSGTPYSNVGIVLKIPNPLTNLVELYVIEATRNAEALLDSWDHSQRQGVNVFRLGERLHSFHGSAIWWLPLQKQLDLKSERAMVKWLTHLHARSSPATILNKSAHSHSRTRPSPAAGKESEGIGGEEKEEEKAEEKEKEREGSLSTFNPPPLIPSASAWLKEWGVSSKIPTLSLIDLYCPALVVGALEKAHLIARAWGVQNSTNLNTSKKEREMAKKNKSDNKLVASLGQVGEVVSLSPEQLHAFKPKDIALLPCYSQPPVLLYSTDDCHNIYKTDHTMKPHTSRPRITPAAIFTFTPNYSQPFLLSTTLQRDEEERQKRVREMVHLEEEHMKSLLTVHRSGTGDGGDNESCISSSTSSSEVFTSEDEEDEEDDDDLENGDMMVGGMEGVGREEEDSDESSESSFSYSASEE